MLANWSGDVFDTAPGVPLFTNTEVQHIVGNIHVPAGKTLTIQPGTVVQFNGGTNLTVDGTLHAAGNSSQTIFVTSYRDDSPTGGADNGALGDWGAITFNAGSDASTLDHVVIRHGGGFPHPAAVIVQADVAISNSTIGQSYGSGLRVIGGNPTLLNDVFVNNGWAAISADLASQLVITDPTVTGNRHNGVVLDAGNIASNVRWNNPALPYLLSGTVTVSAGAMLEIDAGQTVQLGMPNHTGANLIVDGTLKATGIEAAPVTFTSYRDNSSLGGADDALNGDWGAITFNAGSDASTLDHVMIRHGGGYSQVAEVVVSADVAISNSTIGQSYGTGLRVNGSNPTLLKNAFVNNGWAAVSADLASHPTITSPTVTGNRVYNGMLLDVGSLPADTTWDNTDIVYVPQAGTMTVPAGITLTVAPGLIVKPDVNIFKTNMLRVEGTLKAQGTADEPIVFTALPDASVGGSTNQGSVLGPGLGYGFLFTTTSADNVMDHVEVRYGASIEFVVDGRLGTLSADGPLTLSNSIVRNSGHVGVFVSPTGTATLTNNLIVNNVSGIQAQAGSTLTAVNNTVDGSPVYGVILDSPNATLTNNLVTNSGRAGIQQTGPTNLTMSFNNVFNPGRANYNGLPDQTGLSGNISLDPKYFNRANLQFHIRPGSPVEDAGTSSGAPTTDFFGNPRFDDPNIAGRGDGSGYDMGAIEVQEVATSTIDLATFNVNGPTTGTPGMNATVNWTVKNIGSDAATGTWSDAIYLSDTPNWTPNARFLKRVQHTGDLGPDQVYTASTDVTLDNVLPGNHYFIVRTNDLSDLFEGLATANNAGVSASPIGFDISTLTLNTPFDGQFAAVDEADYYQITVDGGQTLEFSLQSAAASGATELYVSRGAVPSRSQFDFGSSALAPNQKIVVPTTQPGAYYVLAYAVAGAAATSAYTLTATQSMFGVQGVSPATAGNAGRVTLTIHGALLTADTQASLIAPDNSVIAAVSTHLTDATRLQATFDLAGKPPGQYSVQLTRGAQNATAANALTVTPGTAGHLKVGFLVPGAIRGGRQGTVTVEYTNDGGADLPAPILSVTSDVPTLRFTTDSGIRGTTVEFLAINPNGPAGVLPPGARGSMDLHFIAGADTPNTIRFKLSRQSSQMDSTALNWVAAKDSLRPPNVPAGAWDAVYANFMADVGTTVGQFQALLDRQATYLSRLGEYTGDEGRLLAAEFQQAGNFGAIARRYTLGAFGRGIPDPTALKATADANGNVAIVVGSQSRPFFVQPNGTYRGASGDFGALTRENGAYRLKETDGSLIVFHTDGRLDYQQDRNGNRVTAGYTGSQLTSYTDNFGNVSTLRYNAQGRIDRITDAVGRETNFTYDAAGEHLLSIAKAQGTQQFAYVTGQGPQKEHAVASITHIDGTHTFFTYDSRGRLSKTTADGGANEVTYTYDGLGGVTATDAQGGATTALFNEFGLPAMVRDALGQVTRFLYDRHGNVLETLRSDGSIVVSTPDSRGNLSTVVDPLGQSLHATFDAVFGTLQMLRDQNGNTISFRTDARGNPLSFTHPNGSIEKFTYDAAGNLITKVDPLGNQTINTYDAHNLLVRQEFADGSRADYTYDAHRNLATATNAAGTTIYDYDLATDRLSKITYPGGRFLSFTYDAAGRRSKSVDQDGFTVNYSYDALGRLSGLTNGANQPIATYAYDSLGRLQRQDLGNGTFTTYAYDAVGQLTSLVNRAADNSILSQFDYTYDALGRRLTMTTLEGTTTYGYDAKGQLTSLGLPGGRMITYQYDGAGNRIAVNDSGGDTTNYTTNNMNQYTAAGSAQFTYDANGNLITRTDNSGTTTYTYNLLGQLSSVATPTDTFTYVYDAVGNRLAVERNGARTNYLIDPLGLGHVVGEYNAAGQLVAHYTQGAGLTSRVDAGGAAAYFAFDGIGNTSVITAANGAVANQYSYLPFGESLTATGSLPNSFTFGGQFGVMDEGNGLYYMRARYYHAGMGRFTAMDPIGPSGGVNLYAYTGNDPVNRIDPSGTIEQVTLINQLLRILGAIPGPTAAAEHAAIGGDAAYAVYRNYASWRAFLTQLTRAELVAFAQGEGLAVTEAMLVEGGAVGGGTVGGTALGNTLAVGGGGGAGGGGTLAVGAVESGGATLALEGGGAAVTGDTVALTAGGTGGAGAAGAGGLSAGGAVGIGLAGGIAIGYIIGHAVGGDKFDDSLDRFFFDPPVVTEQGETVLGYGQHILDKAMELNIAPDVLVELIREGTIEKLGAVDPNDISGPLGFGDAHFVTPDQTFPYIIHFENKPTATAPALVVAVTQQLDAKLDWNTFELGDFGFGKYVVDVPEGRRFYSTRVDASDTVGAFVDVTADFDPTTGQATWTFTSIDPATGALPEGVTDGFLPPEDGAGSGQGFVTYRVDPKAGGATGVTIPAQARVIFEAGLPDESFLDTPVFTNTFDTDAPTSQVDPLPAVSGEDFTVRWSGQDVGGSGVASYDVYVSVDEGEFTLWLAAQTQTSAVYSGEADRSYRFYTIARDQVGWIEAPPLTPDAETRVSLLTWTNSANPYDIDVDGILSIADLLPIISTLRENGTPFFLPAPSPEFSPPPCVDPNSDNRVDLVDLLIVVQALRAQLEGAAGTGESLLPEQEAEEDPGLTGVRDFVFARDLLGAELASRTGASVGNAAAPHTPMSPATARLSSAHDLVFSMIGEIGKRHRPKFDARDRAGPWEEDDLLHGLLEGRLSCGPAPVS